MGFPTKRLAVLPWYTNTHSRYYVLIAACVVARKVEWIRNACLAAVLLFPAIAALHGIVLAALHVDGESNDPIATVDASRPVRLIETINESNTL